MMSLLKGYAGTLRGLRDELASAQAKERLLYAMLGAALFSLAAHGYAYFGFAPLHDSVNYIDYHSGAWEVSIGRFLEPVYGALRGRYTMPWFAGMLSMLYTGLSAFLICDLLEMRDKWIVMLSAGFLAANATMTNTMLAFTSFCDIYTFALLLACAGAYLAIRVPNLPGAALSALFFAASLGMYQSYVLVGVLLMMQHVFRQALRERRLIRNCARTWLRMAAILLLTMAIYLVAYRASLRRYGLSGAPASYNSPSSLLGMSLTEMLPYIKSAYASFAAYFFGYGQAELTGFHMANLLLMAIAGGMLLVYLWRERLPAANVALAALVIAAFPAVSQATSILTRSGQIYFLAAPGVFMLYPFLLEWITAPAPAGAKKEQVRLFMRSRCMRAVIYALCGAVLFINVRVSNGLYTYQRVQYDKTHSYLTRLMERIDTTEGYVPGETEVVFVGFLSSTLVNLDPPEDAEWMSGLNRTGVTYMMVFESYFRMLGEEINVLLDHSGLPDYAQTEEVRAMAAYPQAGCTRMIDGRLIVKLSEI